MIASCGNVLLFAAGNPLRKKTECTWSCSRSYGAMLIMNPASYPNNNKKSKTFAVLSNSPQHAQLVQEMKIRLAQHHRDLPLGKNGRDDEELLLWFLKDRKFDMDAAIGKLVQSLMWRREFGVDQITEESVKDIGSMGKAYLHTSPDVKGRPVVVVVAAKHFPARDDLLESQKLCVYLIEKALNQLPEGEEKFLGIFDLRGFTSANADFKFVKFLVDLFYNYYPKRLAQVLFVEAPFIFQPGWKLVKPWLKSYSSLVRFCSVDVVRKEYFLPDNIPPDFKTY